MQDNRDKTLWRIEMLGGLTARQVRQGDRVLTRFRTQKAALLLAYLALHLHRSHPREVLIELLWPDTDPDAGRANLRVALTHLRHPLEPPGIPQGSVLLADRNAVRLNPNSVTTDVEEFEAALRAAARARSEADRTTALEEALALYRGEFLPGFYEEWVIEEQRRLSERHEQAVAEHAALTQTTEGEKGRKGEGEQRPVSRSPLPPFIPSALPTGTVTFLLTDIEGSTGLSGQHGDLYQTARKQHDALLREAFRAHNGMEFKEVGDGFLVAFQSVGDALMCAIAGQRALETAVWPEATGALRVRMALHTGQAAPEEGDYHSPTVDRAARILSAGHGGQILCSDVVAALLRADLEPGVAFKDLGRWRLKGLAEPQRLHQVNWPDMARSEFPPPNAGPLHTPNIPPTFTRFFGREEEIARLQELLSPLLPFSPSPRLVTLTGPGGTGKTRLAIEAAHGLVEDYSGAVWFVPLADLSDPRLIGSAIVGALPDERDPRAEPLDQVIAFLNQTEGSAQGPAPKLLALDNVEHLLASDRRKGEDAAAVVRVLLERCPALTLLVTSRQRLDLEGEQEFPVPPLPTPEIEPQRHSEWRAAPSTSQRDAEVSQRESESRTPEHLVSFASVQLFVDRAQKVQPDFQITGGPKGNAEAVAALCDRLEGIPLALELAAARIQMRTPAQMLAQLERRFDFLVSRRRDITERHRTLHAAIEWSVRLLSPEVRRFFCRLSVFRGGWTEEAAAEVALTPPSPDRLVDGASRHSSQEQERGEPSGQTSPVFGGGAGGGGLALDYLTQLRDASLIRAEESGEAMRYRMLDSLREFAAEQLAEEERAVLAERHLDCFLALAEEAERQFRGPEQVTWLERLDMERDNLWAALDFGFSTSDFRLDGDQIQNPKSKIQTALRLAGALWRFWDLRGNWSEGRKQLGNLLAQEGALERTGARAKALNGAGALAYRQGDYASAHSLYAECLVICRELDAESGVAAALLNLGNLAYEQGRFEEARAHYEESLSLRRALEDQQGIADSLSNLGNLDVRQGDVESARSRFEESLSLRRALEDQQGIAASLINLGQVAYEQSRFEEARAYYEESLAINRVVGSKQLLAYALHNLGNLIFDRSDLESARAHYVESLGIFQEINDKGGIIASLEALAGLAAAQAKSKIQNGEGSAALGNGRSAAGSARRAPAAR